MPHNKITTILLGLDGVIVDTEKYYDDFWNNLAHEKGLKIDNFAAVIRGMTINSIIELYFAIAPIDEKRAIKKACSKMEMNIPYNDIKIPGILEFIKYVKETDYKLGLVTSSPTAKVGEMLCDLELNGGVFDSIITADSIKKGKPDPLGYVTASANLGVLPNQCAVFEDSFTGIKAATYAFMRVIGVSTILDPDFMNDYTFGVIPDFTDLDRIKKLLV